MLEILWSLAGAIFIIFGYVFGIMLVLMVTTIIVVISIRLITHIVPNSKLAKWANKHISITITKD